MPSELDCSIIKEAALYDESIRWRGARRSDGGRGVLGLGVAVKVAMEGRSMAGNQPNFARIEKPRLIVARDDIYRRASHLFFIKSQSLSFGLSSLIARCQLVFTSLTALSACSGVPLFLKAS